MEWRLKASLYSKPGCRYGVLYLGIIQYAPIVEHIVGNSLAMVDWRNEG